MEHETVPTVQRHRLRLELRRARESAGLTQRQAATALRWSVSKVVRIEAGQSRISHTDLKALLDLYGVNNPGVFANLADLAEQSRRQPWNAYRDVLKPEFVVYLGYESCATRLRAFQRDVIHGLLQTEDYTRNLVQAMESANPLSEITDRRVEARLKRQLLLHKESPPQLSFVLDEATVRRPPGSDEHARGVLRAQLQWLKEVARLPSVAIQILPISYGLHFGSKGPFAVLDFPGDDGNIVYLEGSRGNSMLDESPEQVKFYSGLFEQLSAAATEPDSLGPFLDDVCRDLV